MNEMHVNGAVIGFGKGGKTLAVFLANQGMQTALFDVVAMSGARYVLLYF